ncbi:hypothetical protein BDV41DRAFT_552937 [Aspergillus transmontanensis]|uniref:Uncharacterized protein n=1 Tax=Aspergillus transmontanensis TaxID=1034304 RepID=A0A5N6VIG3_9EURO|nr:hypothetical protein BDV41DRAFT_552937 [Aspergillus transmontanensis]
MRALIYSWSSYTIAWRVYHISRDFVIAVLTALCAGCQAWHSYPTRDCLSRPGFQTWERRIAALRYSQWDRLREFNLSTGDDQQSHLSAILHPRSSL